MTASEAIEKWPEMTDRERDAAIAECVKGAANVREFDMTANIESDDGRYVVRKAIPHYTTCIKAAWELVEWAGEQSLPLQRRFGEALKECIWSDKAPFKAGWPVALFLLKPEHIGLAALKAVAEVTKDPPEDDETTIAVPVFLGSILGSVDRVEFTQEEFERWKRLPREWRWQWCIDKLRRKHDEQ